jgi:hypothetical protein
MDILQTVITGAFIVGCITIVSTIVSTLVLLGSSDYSVKCLAAHIMDILKLIGQRARNN